MQYELAGAAHAAHAAHAAAVRAVECRLRATELAEGRRVGAEDVRRAHTALAAARQRAATAQRRLAALRLQQRGDPHHRPQSQDRACSACGPEADLASLRRRARGLAMDKLFLAYRSLGGRCDELDVDGFLHAVLELPPEEVPVLAHAVWEFTEL